MNTPGSTLLEDMEVKEEEEKISLLFWNIQGLHARLKDFEFISMCQNFSILCFQETLLATHDKPEIPGYTAYYHSNQNKRGGVAIFIKDKLKDKITHTEDIRRSNVLWTVAATRRCTYCLATVYNTHEASKFREVKFFENLTDDISVLSHRFNNPVFIVVGDFNARTANQTEFSPDEVDEYFGSSIPNDPIHCLPRNSCDNVINSEGKKLLAFCRESNLLICNGRTQADTHGEFTYVSTKGKSTIDYALVSPSLLLERRVQLRVLDSLLTLHKPIVLDLPLRVRSNVAPRVVFNKTRPLLSRIILKSEKDKLEFIQRFENYFPLFEPGMMPLLRAHKTSDVATRLTEFIRMVGRPFSVSPKQSNGPSWYTKQHKVLKNTARAALRKYKRTRKQYALQTFCVVKKEYRRLIRQSKRDYSDRLKHDLKEALTSNDNSRLWRSIKRSMGKNRRQSHIRIPAGDWVGHFRSILCHASTDREEWTVDESSLPCVEILDRKITIPEVWKSIEKIKKSKAPGPSGVSGSLIKAVKSTISPFLSNFFNVILDSGKYPKEYTNALLFTIFKGSGDPSKPDFYRGIALLDHVGKIFTRIMKQRMTRWADVHNLIDDTQGGFRQGRQTSDNALIIDTLVKEQLHQYGGRLYVALIDKRKAFDFCPRSAVLFRLFQLGISQKVFRVVKSMFSNSTFRVKIDNTTSTEDTRSTSGIFQGCIWSPLLFILFLDGICESLSEIDSDSPQLSDRTLRHLLWADDLSLISKTTHGLQKLLDALSTFCQYWGIQVNTSKTKVIVFKKGNRRGKDEKWFYDGKEIEVTHTARYLGFLFSSNGLWRQHKLLAVQKANRALIPLLSFYYRHRDLHGKFYRSLYFSLVESVILYGSEIWGVFYKDRDGVDTVSRLLTSLGMLDKPMLKFFKIFLGVPRSSVSAGVLLEFGVNRIYSRIVTRVINYWIKLAMLPDSHLMKNCLAKQNDMIDLGMKPWLFFVKEILFSYGFGYIWERGFPDGRKFRRLFANRASEIHSTVLLSEARERKSLEFYLSRKTQTSEIEQYTAKSHAERRLTAVVRLNLKYALPWYPDSSFCKLCNSVIEEECSWNHFLYECSSLPPVDPLTVKVPYPFCIQGILAGRNTDLYKRLTFVTTKPSSLEAEYI